MTPDERSRLDRLCETVHGRPAGPHGPARKGMAEKVDSMVPTLEYVARICGVQMKIFWAIVLGAATAVGTWLMTYMLTKH